MSLFIVYEIDTHSQPEGGSAETEREAVFTSSQVGAFYAADQKAACAKAAGWHGKAGVFAAVKAEAYKLELGAEPKVFDDTAAEEARKKYVEAREKAEKG
jgi:hypothetical protein